MMRLDTKAWMGQGVDVTCLYGYVPGPALYEGVVELFQRTFTCGERDESHQGMHGVEIAAYHQRC